MSKSWFRVPSPAFIISLIALFLALGGTSYAASKLILSTDKDAKADAKLVRKLAPSLKVQYAKTAGIAGNAASATTAAQLGGVPAAGYQRSTLAAGQTERGGYSAWGLASSYLGSYATFSIPLAAGLDSGHVYFIPHNTTRRRNAQGPIHRPMRPAEICASTKPTATTAICKGSNRTRAAKRGRTPTGSASTSKPQAAGAAGVTERGR